MSKIQKIDRPGGDLGRVDAKDVNDIIDILNTLIADKSDLTTFSVDTITEQTTGHGVIADSVTLKDGTVLTAAGAVGTPAIRMNDTDSGFYQVSATQIGVSIGGALKAGFDANGIYTSTLTEQITDVGITFTDPINYASATGITAHSGGGQASAVVLTAEYSEITVCAADLDSVKHEAAVAGMRRKIINSSSAILSVYPATGETINGGAANASVNIFPGFTVEFVCETTGAWITSPNLSGSIGQATSISTAVTLNTISGYINTQAASAAAGASHTFTVNNSKVRATSVILCTLTRYTGTWVTDGCPLVSINTVADGSFVVNITNVHSANALSGNLTITFAIQP